MKLFNKESKKNKETRSLPMSKKGKSALIALLSSFKTTRGINTAPPSL